MRAALPLLLAALLAGPFASSAEAAKGSSVPWVEDDYARALSEARARKLPILLEAWAPWCHSCRSMQAFVFPDPRLAAHAGDVVWLSIDTEKAVNASVLEKYPVSAWPSLFVIDPAKETILLRWTGSATVEQLVEFVGQGKRTLAGGQAGLDEPLAIADRLNGAAQYPEAAAAYATAIAAAPKDWSALPRAADAMIFALQMSDETLRCAQAARELLPRIAGTPAAANVALAGLDCTLGIDKALPARAGLIAYFEKACREAAQNPNLASDDRSGHYQVLIAAREDAGDERGERALETEWVQMLERAAQTAPSPEARAAFDSHRLGAYLEIGEPQRALPMLEASESDFPADYNPPARLAAAYRALKDYDKALAASDRALARAYGPRRLLILRTRADILVEKGESGAAKKVLEQALAEARALPEAQRSKRTLAALEKQLAAIG